MLAGICEKFFEIAQNIRAFGENFSHQEAPVNRLTVEADVWHSADELVGCKSLNDS
jgi:hypothetical protein